MANKGNSWNSFMQSREAQFILYGICIAACIYYGVDGILELMSSDRSAMYIQAMGETTYRVVMILRVVVCFGTGAAFLRVLLRNARDRENWPPRKS